jgi:hypothetical protein
MFVTSNTKEFVSTSLPDFFELTSCSFKMCGSWKAESLLLYVGSRPGFQLGALQACADPLERPHINPLSCRANMAHVRQSRPDSGLDVQALVLESIQVVPFSLESGQQVPGFGRGKNLRKAILSKCETVPRRAHI